MLEVAGAERLELSTVGFGDRCSTIRTMPLWNCRSIINKLPLFVKGAFVNKFNVFLTMAYLRLLFSHQFKFFLHLFVQVSSFQSN